MFRKLTVIAVAALACSGAMAASQTFNFNTQGGTLDALAFATSLQGGINWQTFGATSFTNVLLDGGTTGLTAGMTGPNGSYLNYNFNLGSSATSHTISYNVVSTGTGGPAPSFSGTGWTSTVHTSTPTHVQVSSVPEPETYAMMLAGLGALGFVGRRRKAK